MIGAHLSHALHFLTHESKIGGPIAIIGAVIGFFVVNAPLTVKTAPCMTNQDGSQYCFGTAFNPEGLTAHLGGAVIGGAIGVGVVLLLVALFGIPKDKLGISDE
jgi:hypothetical protein